MMLKNKKGSAYSAILMAVILFMVGMLVANFLKSPIDDARTSLSCSSSTTISDGTKWMCLGVDMTMIYFIILICSIAGGAILDRVLI